MATTIRLARHGAKKRPFYRIVVADRRARRDGRRLDQIGYYDPNQEPALVRFDEQKLERWLRLGARPTLIVEQLMKRWRHSQGSVGASGVPAPENGEA
jgi:small subunit ribosomal protein S16